MTHQQQPEGNLSRRDFIKTTTAATAAASVGIMPGSLAEKNPKSQPPSVKGVRQPAMAHWSITGKEIVSLWTDIWPKIVALAWHSSSYRCAFEEASASRRADEARRIADIIGVHYASNTPIECVNPDALGMGIQKTIITTRVKTLLDSEDRDKIIRCLLDQGFEDLARKIEQGFGEARTTTEKEIEIPWTCPEQLYGDTYFYLNDTGFIMPWPAPPTAEEVFIGYWQGGGILPRVNRLYKEPNVNRSQIYTETAGVRTWKDAPTLPPKPPAPGNTPPNDYARNLQERILRNRFLLERLLDHDLTPAVCDGLHVVNPDGLSGVALITLIEKWPRVVAHKWANPNAASVSNFSNYIANPGDTASRDAVRAHIMPEVWTEWPELIGDDLIVDTAADDIVISHITAAGPTAVEKLEIKVPFPNLATPVTTLPLFEELIIGHASNPMYSNCY